jgi:hypothetical protein
MCRRRRSCTCARSSPNGLEGAACRGSRCRYAHRGLPRSIQA